MEALAVERAAGDPASPFAGPPEAKDPPPATAQAPRNPLVSKVLRFFRPQPAGA